MQVVFLKERVGQAVYWLARMVEGNEDPKFIARRLIISVRLVL